MADRHAAGRLTADKCTNGQPVPGSGWLGGRDLRRPFGEPLDSWRTPSGGVQQLGSDEIGAVGQWAHGDTPATCLHDARSRPNADTVARRHQHSHEFERGCQKRTVQRGRPAGSTTYEPEPAIAFGLAVRVARMEQGMAQEELASLAEIERSHMGKIERGEHMPTLALIFRIAAALNRSAADLIAATDKNLRSGLKT